MAILDPQSRSKFLSAPVEPIDNARAVITLHQMSSGGAIGTDPLQVITLFHASSIETPQEERVQILASNVDSGKLYLFGRMPRLYSVTGFIVDSDLQWSGQILEEGGFVSGPGQGLNKDDRAYRGHLLKRWMELYEKEIRLSVCLRLNRILKLRWRSTESYGYILGQARSMEFGAPNMYTLGVTFAVIFDEESIDEPIVRIPDGKGGKKEVPGMISIENTARLVREPQQAKDTGPKSEMGKTASERTRFPRMGAVLVRDPFEE